MKTLYKYFIPMDGKVRLPLGAEVLTVNAQGDGIYIWAEVETLNSTTEERVFEIYPTGAEIKPHKYEQHRKFLASVFINGYVYHVYELTTNLHPLPKELK
jgi:hypothetical protein